jgi:hypothetical protein
MKKQYWTLALLGAAAAMYGVACSGDDNKNDGGTDGGPADTGGGDVAKPDSGGDAGDAGPSFPAMPALKATQVDRMGRPAINTALNHVFDPTVSADGGAGAVAKDTYNADKNVAGWTAAYAPQFAGNLGIFDALDTDGGTGSGCGNQLGFVVAHSYATIAGLTADDRLYIDTSKTTCSIYLGVELNATTLQPNTDCGGRKLSYDVIDATYSAVAGAAVSDGVGPVAAKTNGTTFPYLAAPQ